MITFISAVPGGGKTLSAVEILYDLSVANIKNLRYNYLLFKTIIDKLTELNLLEELRTVTITTGQGLEQKTDILFFDPDYFDFLKEEYNLNVVLQERFKELIRNYPDYYFERVYHLSEILKRVNQEHNLQFPLFKHVRPFFTNIEALSLAQARALPEKNDWRDTPFGSVLVYDEAQLIDIFSEEHRAVDPIVKALTKHRHKSYDIYFISQDPALVHKYIRKLAGHHIHLINAFGFESSIRLEWSTCQEQPNAFRNIARSEVSKRYTFPKELYGVYKSTTASTRKKRYPWKKIAIIAALGAVGLWGVSNIFAPNNALVAMATGDKYGAEYKKEQNKEKKDATQKTSTDAPSVATQEQTTAKTAEQTDQASSASDPVTTNTSPAQYSVQYDPSKPYEFEPPSNPTVVNNRVFSGCFCDNKGLCNAYDQQGIRINGISQDVCRDVIKDSSSRPFDYFGNRTASTERVSTSELTQSAL